jgi:hypothetical protein
MPTNWIIDGILLAVAIGSIFLLMRYSLQKNTIMVWVWGVVMTIAVAVLLWPRFAS